MAAERVRKGASRLTTRERDRADLPCPTLTDRQIDDLRTPVILLAQPLCEHLWGKKFY